jgi:GH24 family phage-related lysozyme (muramidase)
MRSEKALKLILDAEGCDLAPNYPGGASGVTYGHGYDLGYNTKEQIQNDWGALVNGNVLAFMLSCAGRKAEDAKRMITTQTKTLRITKEAAAKVFQERTLPRFERIARESYEGFENLPIDAQGAIVSLVFNRGASWGIEGQKSWETRREMRELAPLIKDGDLDGIAVKIIEMKRLWEGKGLDGLITRRINEAALVSGSSIS